jgi:hypothetical protein
VEFATVEKSKIEKRKGKREKRKEKVKEGN